MPEGNLALFFRCVNEASGLRNDFQRIFRVGGLQLCRCRRAAGGSFDRISRIYQDGGGSALPKERVLTMDVEIGFGASRFASGPSRSAILLLGPTGSGKTPLGQCLERKGLWGRQCLHFDFGENLRRVAAGAFRPERLTEADIAVVRRALQTGALLEDRHFHIAREILLSFVEVRVAGPADLIVLNGLPRHAGQAKEVDAIVNVRMVVHLDCAPRVVFERLRLNAGGDRAGRADDSAEAVRRKIATFNLRTAPLLDHYAAVGVWLRSVNVEADTGPEDIRRLLEAAAPA